MIRAPEILVMPGAYDVLSAILFEKMGFKAIPGTSGGTAAALGYPDGEVMSRDLTVEITGNIAQAVSLPVNADAEVGPGEFPCSNFTAGLWYKGRGATKKGKSP